MAFYLTGRVPAKAAVSSGLAMFTVAFMTHFAHCTVGFKYLGFLLRKQLPLYSTIKEAAFKWEYVPIN